MLVLSRKVNETVIIGDNIKVMVVDIIGNRVKLGFKAPRDISVFREEVVRRVEEGQPKSNVTMTSLIKERNHGETIGD